MAGKPTNDLIDDVVPLARKLRSLGCKTDWARELRRQDRKTADYLSQQIYPPEFSAPLGILLELTYRCNLRCIMCYNNSYLQAGKNELSDREWLSVAKEAARLGIFECIISGGEPLLRKSLVFKIMDIMHEAKVMHVLITNGWLVDKKTVTRLRKYFYRYIQVSIDGSRPEIHDKIRQVKGSWKKAVNAAAAIVANGLPLCIAHILTRLNFNHLEEMIDLSIFLGATNLIVDRAVLMGMAVTNSDRMKLPRGWQKRFFKVIEHARKFHSDKINIVTSMDPAISMRRKALEPTKSVLIKPNGNVKLSCMMPHSFGNIRNKSLLEIWNDGMKSGWQHPEVQRFIRAVRCNEDLLRLKRRGFPLPHLDDDITLS